MELWKFPKMHIPLIIISLWIAAVLAYPLRRGAAADIQVLGTLWILVAKRVADRVAILAFANVFEQLESAFYAQALKQFNASSFEAAGFASSQIPIQQIQTIANDDNIHAITLQVCEVL